MIVSKIAAVVVVYNKNVSESITCDRLLKLNRNEVTLVIVDNSEKETTNDEYCRSRNTVLGIVKCCGLGAQIAKKTKSPAILFKAVGLTFKSWITKM